MTMKIKQRQRTLLLLLIGSFLLLFGDSYGQDLLDAVKDSSQLVLELKDAYRAFHVNNIISDQKGLINVFLHDGSDDDIKKLLDDYIKACGSIKKIHFYNDTLHSYVSKYLVLTIQSYKIARNKGFSSSQFAKDYEKYKKEVSKYMDYLYSTYSTGHFITMTEEEYWENNEKKKYIKSPDYKKYESLKKTNLKEALALLSKISGQTSNFQEYSIYQIELADQYVKHSDSLGENPNEKAIEIYKSIVDRKEYSIYLFEAWLKWRLVNQQHIHGLSKSSEIPNNEYDKVREEVALTVLHYITANHKDEMAINEFLLMATHDIVKRFGDYPYGNQNTVEYHQTFDEKK